MKSNQTTTRHNLHAHTYLILYSKQILLPFVAGKQARRLHLLIIKMKLFLCQHQLGIVVNFLYFFLLCFKLYFLTPTTVACTHTHTHESTMKKFCYTFLIYLLLLFLEIFWKKFVAFYKLGSKLKKYPQFIIFETIVAEG